MTLIESLGYTLLHSLWQGAVLAVLLALLMLLFSKRSAQFRYFIAITALFTMLAVSVFTFCNLYFFSSPSPADAIPAQQTLGKTQAAGEIITVQLAPVQESLYEKFSNYFEEHLPLIVIIWLAGVLVLTLRFIGGLAYIRRMQTYRIEKVSEEWFAITQEIAGKLGIRRTIQIWESALAKVPVAIGYFKPVILLPIGTFTGLSPQQIEAILAHELAHIARNDYWVNLLQSVLEIVFFFHPAVWWMSGIIRQERENCCDDLAVQLNGNGLVFAQALTNLEIFRSAPQLAMAANRGSLLPRIQRLIQKAPQKATFTEGLLASGVVLMCLLAVSVSAVAQWQQKEPEQTMPETQKVVVVSDTAFYITGDKMLKTSFEDTTKKVRELVIVKNKKGKVTDVMIDGKKLPKSQLKDYEKYIEKALKEADEKEEWTIMDSEIFEIPLPPDPPVAPAPPEALTLVETPELLALTEVFDSETQLRNQYRIVYEELEQLNKQKSIAPANESGIWDKKIQEKQELLEKYKRQLNDIRHRNQEHQEINNVQVFKEQELANLRDLQLEEVQRQSEQAKRDAELAQQQAEFAQKEAKEMQLKHEKMSKELGEELKKDGLIEDARHFRFTLTREDLFINDKKQPDIIYEKYKKWIKQNYKIEVSELGENGSFEISTDKSNRNFNVGGKDIYVYGYQSKPFIKKDYPAQRSRSYQPLTPSKRATVIADKLYTLNGSVSGTWSYAHSTDDSLKASYNENFDPKEMLITVKLKNSFVKVYKGKEHIEVKVEGKYPSFMINNREILFQEVEKLTASEIENIEGGNAGGFYNKNPNGYINIRTKRK